MKLEYQALTCSRKAVSRNKKNAEARRQEIRRLAAAGHSKKHIATILCLHLETVQKVLRQWRAGAA